MNRLGYLLMATTIAGAAGIAGAANPQAIIHTGMGDIRIELFPDKAPKTVENFIALAKGTKSWQDPRTREVVNNRPLYSGTKFHRTMKEFMIQGGDPAGTGAGDVGFTIPGEISDLNFNQVGMVAMANKGGNPNSASSQFFITVAPVPQLNPSPRGAYAIFGKVVAGQDIANKISELPSEPGSGKALQPVTINSIEIVDAGKAVPGKDALDKPTSSAKEKDSSAPGSK